ncbi:MAG: superoxide dismutase [Verrucomicrobiota bacterium]
MTATSSPRSYRQLESPFTRLLSRRRLLTQGSLAAAGLWVTGRAGGMAWAQQSDAAQGPFQVEPLPYAADALEPSIDARTMTVHHNKHYAGYVRKLNTALESAPDLAGMPLEKILAHLDKAPESVQTALRNNGGGAANHALFWKLMSPKKGQKPSGALAKDLDATFGSYDKFTEDFSGAAATVFGSGWAWLSLDPSGKLIIEKTANQNSPLMEGRQPVLGLDVWEHAYYLKYQNKRADYIKAWWDVVNWDFVSGRYEELKKAA